jgi:cysteine desulfurase
MSRAPAVYLDYNATAPIRPEAQDAAVCALRIGANPSSVHGMGRVARAAVEGARAEVARLVGARDEQVIFTSGGSEANRIAVDAGIDGDAVGLAAAAPSSSPPSMTASCAPPWPPGTGPRSGR